MSRFLSLFSYIFPGSLLVAGLLLLSKSWLVLQESVQGLECFCPSCQELAVVEGGVASLGLIQADIQGAVKKPGVYQLRLGQRIGDLVATAGGLTDELDETRFIKTINLAQLLEDQDKVYIPLLGDETDDSGLVVGQQDDSDADQVSINQATTEKLQTLNGIGAVKAQAIIAGRPYTSLEELVEKKILSESLLTDLRASLTL